jgi:hypothetical protein
MEIADRCFISLYPYVHLLTKYIHILHQKLIGAVKCEYTSKVVVGLFEQVVLFG